MVLLPLHPNFGTGGRRERFHRCLAFLEDEGAEIRGAISEVVGELGRGHAEWRTARPRELQTRPLWDALDVDGSAHEVWRCTQAGKNRHPDAGPRHREQDRWRAVLVHDVEDSVRGWVPDLVMRYR